jgi:hypothetical protein
MAKKKIVKKSAPKKAVKKSAPKKAVKKGQTGTSNIALDKLRQAKPAGKRTTEYGSVYYERRANRSDAGKLLGIKISGFFDTNTIITLDDLKKQYSKLAKLYHPDAGGTNEQFVKMKDEYDKLIKKILSGSKLSDEQIKNEFEIDENLRSLVDAIINLPLIEIEIIGKWIWVSGNTYPIRSELKSAGFSFAPKKKLWYYAGSKSSGRGNMDIEEIRNAYSTNKIKMKDSQIKKISGIGAEYNISIPTSKRNKIKKALKNLTNKINKRIN